MTSVGAREDRRAEDHDTRANRADHPPGTEVALVRDERHIGMWINENVQPTSRGRSVPTNAIVSPVPRLMGLLSLGLWFLRAELVPNLFQG